MYRNSINIFARIISPVIAVWLAASISFCQSSAPAAELPIICAILSPAAGPELPVVSMLQSELAGRSQIRLVERDQIRAILQEQQMSSLFTADGTSQRFKLGQLLKADLLICLRQLKPDAPLQIVVCQSSSGLRLLNESVALPTNSSEIVTALMRQIDSATEKLRKGANEICAVLPFLSLDFEHELDHLRYAYANLAEQVMLSRPGVLVVDLEEAQSLGREIAFGGEGIKRSSPLYLLGEYRNDSIDGRRSVRVKLVLKRGQTELETVEKSGLTPDEVPGFLIGSTNSVLDRLHRTAQPTWNSAAEAQQLSERAAGFLKLGQQKQAADLLEAALLLMPNDPQLLRQTVEAIDRAVRSDDPASFPRTREHATTATNTYLRGLAHLEAYLMAVKAPALRPTSKNLEFGWSFLRSGSWTMTGHPEEIPAEWRAVLEHGQKIEREACYRMARLRAEAGYLDDWLFVSEAIYGMDPMEQWNVLLKMLDELQDVPGAGERTVAYACQGYSAEILARPGGKEFLDKLATFRNPEVRTASERLKMAINRTIAQNKLIEAPMGAWDRPRPLPKGSTSRVVPCDAPAMDCIAIDSDRDIFWNYNTVAVVTRKDQPLRNLTTPQLNDRFTQACFDGKFFWAAAVRHRNDESRIVVVDPRTEQSWELTRKDGLPNSRSEIRTGTGNAAHSIVIAPIAPGKVLLAASFDHRVWVATAEFDPVRGATIKVFHEAIEEGRQDDPQLWRNTKAAFEPLYAFSLSQPRNDRTTGECLILVGRGNLNIEMMEHPLLIDPHALTVSVLPDKIPWMERQFANRGSALFWPQRLVVGGRGNVVQVAIRRLGFPDMKVATVADTASKDQFQDVSLIFLSKRVLVLGSEIWSSDVPQGPFTRLDDACPSDFRRPIWNHSAMYGDYVYIGDKSYQLRFD